MAVPARQTPQKKATATLQRTPVTWDVDFRVPRRRQRVTWRGIEYIYWLAGRDWPK